ncbi:MAG: YkgJ family cysteine cluster protein [Thermoprotei archaeon]|nr:YkgJ family cysteine cluster protein [Thermoprotei archaeon]
MRRLTRIRLSSMLDFVNFGSICKGCTVNCCRRFYAVLLDDEEEEFKDVADTIETPLGRVRTLGNPKGGICPFLTREGLCGIYEKRPLDCRLWPLMVHYDFEKDEYIIILDLECPAAAENKIPQELLEKMVKTVITMLTSNNLNKDWVKRFTLTPWPKNYTEIARIKAPQSHGDLQ